MFTWVFAVLDIVPQEFVTLGVAGVLVTMGFRMWLILKKDVLDEQSRKLGEAVEHDRQQRQRIDDLEQEARLRERRIWALERAIVRAGLSLPVEEDQQ